MKNIYKILLTALGIGVVSVGSISCGADTDDAAADPTKIEVYYDEGLAQHDVRTTDALRDSLVDFAMSLQGLPYKMACKGPTAFDCSGFTYYVMNQFDVDVPGTSATQFRHGEKIPTDSVKPGDLLFFKSPTRGVNRVGHVGMVVSVEDEKIEFIHSSSYRGVVIDSLTQPSYERRFMGARRVIE